MKKYKNQIKLFQKKMNKSKYFHLSAFHKNINSLTVKNDKKLNTLGIYNLTTNTITLRNKNDYNTLYHELIHLSTSTLIKNEIVSGLCYSNLINGTNFGIGITEGYTEILRVRYFKIKNFSYKIEAILTKYLELIVDEFEKLFFTNNLLALMQFLEKYNTKEQIFQTIKTIDEISKFKDITKENSNHLNNLILKAIQFLSSTYYEKCSSKEIISNINIREEIEKDLKNISILKSKKIFKKTNMR